MRGFLLVNLLFMATLMTVSSCLYESIFRDDYRYTAIFTQIINAKDKRQLQLQSSAGIIEIRGWSQSMVALLAIKKAKTQQGLQNINVVIEEGPTSIGIRSEYKDPKSGGPVDYILTIPMNMALEVRQGSGTIRIMGYEPSTRIKLTIGSGDVELDQVAASEIQVTVGSGDALLMGITGSLVTACIGNGRLITYLHPDASYQLDAKVGKGSLSVEGFPNAQLQKRGSDLRVRTILGSGRGSLKLCVGTGHLKVKALERSKGD